MWLKQTLACQVGAVAVGEDASGRIFYYHLFWPHSHPAGGVMFFFFGGRLGEADSALWENHFHEF